jgi:hypothetical protein
MPEPRETYKLSGPIVSANVRRMVAILAQDRSQSVEQYLGDLVAEAIHTKWNEFQARMAAEWTADKTEGKERPK